MEENPKERFESIKRYFYQSNFFKNEKIEVTPKFIEDFEFLIKLVVLLDKRNHIESINKIEKLIKVQGILNKNKYHLYINTDLQTKATWKLYQVFADYDKYISNNNGAILDSKIDTIEELINYLEKHNGFERRF